MIPTETGKGGRVGKTMLVGLFFFLFLLLLLSKVTEREMRCSIGSTLLASKELHFVVYDTGRYTISDKRLKKISLEKRGVHAYHYQLIHADSGEEVPLERHPDSQRDAHRYGAKLPVFQDQWTTLYTFEAFPSRYVLRFNHPMIDTASSDSSRIATLSHHSDVINPGKYSVEITPYRSPEAEKKAGIVIVFLFFLSFGLFIVLFSRI